MKSIINNNSNNKNNKILNYFAFLFILLPLFVNEYTWLKYFDHDQYISSQVRVSIWCVDILLLFSGIIILFSNTVRDFLLSNKKLNPPNNIDNSYSIYIFILLFLVMCLSRILFLDYNPLTHGEAEYGQYIALSLSILEKFSFFEAMTYAHHLYIRTQNLLISSVGLSFPITWLFGLNEFTIRICSSVGGILSGIFVFLIIKRQSNTIIALVSLALLAFNPYLITFQRSAYIDSLQITFALFGILLIDKFIEKPNKIFLVFGGIFFCFSVLIKLNSIIFIVIFAILYKIYYQIKFKDIFLIIVSAIIFFNILYIDQLDVAYRSTIGQIFFSKYGSSDISILFSSFRYGLAFFLNAHILYFELTLLPIVLGFLYWKKIDNKYFKLLVLFSFFYFFILPFQGRSFDRYLEIGIITTSAALAFPISYHLGRRHYHIGLIALVLYISWNLFVHRSYVSSLYYHIPYQFIETKVKELRVDNNNRIAIYGGNTGLEYWLSNDRYNKEIVYFDNIDYFLPEDKEEILASKRESSLIMLGDYITQPNYSYSQLLEPSLIKIGDIVIISGIHFYGGEPAPEIYGYDGAGFRVYRHNLLQVSLFYNRFLKDENIQKSYEIQDKIFLSNGSNRLAALILKKYN